ncbi:unnamed protein product [Meloidogyne enterolobii]|uniref:Uncharacterized protein n=1 Tax=Meloidogyne enterolobii TaxID=390850 RepID=A0ACB0YTF0_MELEN
MERNLIRIVLLLLIAQKGKEKVISCRFEGIEGMESKKRWGDRELGGTTTLKRSIDDLCEWSGG